jgi:hypothetical protein
MAAAYVGLAKRENWQAEVRFYRLPKAIDLPVPKFKFRDGETRRWVEDKLVELGASDSRLIALVREAVPDPPAFLAEPRADALGFELRFEGPAVFPRLTGEAGLHQFRKPNGFDNCLVDASDQGADYLPPAGITRRGAIGTQPAQRIYDADAKAAEDLVLKQTVRWGLQPLAEVIGGFVAERLRVTLERLVAG